MMQFSACGCDENMIIGDPSEPTAPTATKGDSGQGSDQRTCTPLQGTSEHATLAHMSKRIEGPRQFASPVGLQYIGVAGRTTRGHHATTHTPTTTAPQRQPLVFQHRGTASGDKHTRRMPPSAPITGRAATSSKRSTKRSEATSFHLGPRWGLFWALDPVAAVRSNPLVDLT
eukprot:CAMPEP_0181251110 /NCGR_PEP_ID=MMETSP1096-20121128/46695_1 /TAXON_ID=156174 ORGANISM="Chrysochromulina ericina, Strain CCMP281" /NCGR_SAMPLE_ID=MMETSP1096 /ASSEMBLY_ACC=CAM_ASM_000453 /LENGTH=171 /DNA_ID=CAMNT_0023348657 /DNA_START=38 /DNA_END=549 /DNA_ORIENTATION=+